MRVYEFAEDQPGHQQYRYSPAIEEYASHCLQGSRRQRRAQRYRRLGRDPVVDS